MPPTSDVGGFKAGLSQEEFLAACFQCVKEKITLDYDKLSVMTGMSKGGAQNKFRIISRKLEALAPGCTGLVPNNNNTTGGGSKKAPKSMAGPSKRKVIDPAPDSDENIDTKSDVKDESTTPSPTKKTKMSATKATKNAATKATKNAATKATKNAATKATKKTTKNGGMKVEPKSEEVVELEDDDNGDVVLESIETGCKEEAK